nr:ribosomal protein S13 [Gastrodia peichatieniana]
MSYSYISGARSRSVPDEQVRIASTKMDGIGPKKAIQVRYRLGISGNIKMNELTQSQIDQMEQIRSQDHVVNWEFQRGERADIERLISLSRYRGIRHQDGSPLRGQRTHTNARTCRKRRSLQRFKKQNSKTDSDTNRIIKEQKLRGLKESKE